MSGAYHHGDLPATLRAATAELVAEKGPSGFSLREVARRAGVSHAAPTHHFGDARGLLTSLATEGMTLLADSLEAAAAESTDTEDWVERSAHAYVSTALSYPGHFEIMFRHDLQRPGDSECAAAGSRAYDELRKMVQAVRADLNPSLDVEDAALLCWSTMQGLVVLAPSLSAMPVATGTEPPPLTTLVSRLSRLLLDGLLPR